MASLKSEDPIDALTKKFEKLQLNLAEQLEFLSAQLEKPAYRPKPSTSSYNNTTPSRSNTNQVICFRCNEPGHVARYCMSEKVQVQSQRYKAKSSANYLTTEETTDEYESEEEVYVG